MNPRADPDRPLAALLGRPGPVTKHVNTGIYIVHFVHFPITSPTFGININVQTMTDAAGVAKRLRFPLYDEIFLPQLFFFYFFSCR